MFEISKLKTDRKTEFDVYKALNTGMQTSSEKADVMEALWSESMKPFSSDWVTTDAACISKE